MNKKTKVNRFNESQWQAIDKERKKDFGNRIMLRRKHLNYSQSELSELTGISENQISNIEHGRSFPKMSNFIMLCDVLECNADYFLSGIIKTDVSNQITDLVATLNPEEKKTVLILLNAYIHREDAVIMDESAYQNN